MIEEKVSPSPMKHLTPVFESWAAASTPPGLSPDTVHLWRVSLDVSMQEFDLAWNLLNERERERAERLKISTHRRRWVVSRGVLKALVGAYTNKRPHMIKFTYGHMGKPGLAPDTNGNTLCFNNSDSEDLAIVAFSINAEVGVDLEKRPRTVRAARITHRRFASAEADPIINVQSDAEMNHRFLACWTRKEAWGKALGVGIRYPMRDIVLCDTLPAPDKLIQHDTGNWWLQQIWPDTKSIACLVVQGEHTQLQCYHMQGSIEDFSLASR